jgi:hypothetical protein
MTKFKSPDDLYQYVAQTIQMLNDINLPHAAKILERVNIIFYTTGSEWLGELGNAAREVERCYSIPDEIQDRLNVIMVAVKETWPKM